MDISAPADGRAIQDASKITPEVFPLNAPLAGGHFIEDEAERKQVRALVSPGRALVRGHVGDRTRATPRWGWVPEWWCRNRGFLEGELGALASRAEAWQDQNRGASPDRAR